MNLTESSVRGILRDAVDDEELEALAESWLELHAALTLAEKSARDSDDDGAFLPYCTACRRCTDDGTMEGPVSHAPDCPFSILGEVTPCQK